LGKAIKKYNFQRSKIVVATKLFSNFIEGKPEESFWGKNAEDSGLINQGGLSRKHIFDQVESSLRRLQLDYIDLYQIHRFDPNTPVEETMEALHDLVRSGKVRYIGASSMWAWQFAKLNTAAKLHGWTTFVTMQNFYNLMYREEEREVIPYSLDAGIGLIPWSPLNRGILGRRVTDAPTVRAENDRFKVPLTDADTAILNRTWELADKYKVTGPQIAFAWLLTKPAVSAPIFGFSKEEHMHDLIRGLDVKLTPEDIKYLEEPYQPRKVVGHI